MVLGSAHSLADEAIELHAVLETRHCDAIIVFGDMRDQPRLLDDLVAATVPVVALWQGTGLEGVDTVNVDNRSGIAMAVDHLVGLGHTRFGFIGGGVHGDLRERRTAFVDRLTEAGMPPDGANVVPALNEPGAGADAFRRLVADGQTSRRPSSPPPITSPSASCTPPTTSASPVPDAVSIVGFDDIPFADLHRPAADHGAQPDHRDGGLAVDLAIDRHGRRPQRPRPHSDVHGACVYRPGPDDRLTGALGREKSPV